MRHQHARRGSLEGHAAGRDLVDGDADKDGDVDMADFALIGKDWGKGQVAAYKGNQDGNTYDPGGLSNPETYYWRIDSVNENDRHPYIEI